MGITLGTHHIDPDTGRITVSGTSGSGLDTQGLTDGLVAARAIPKDNLQTRIDLNSSKITAFGTLRGILSTLRDAANFLRNPPGVANDADNVFKYRAAALTSNTSVSASDYFDVSAQPGTSVQNYNATTTSLAQVTKQRTSSFLLRTRILA